jgi:hypothetical protein
MAADQARFGAVRLGRDMAGRGVLGRHVALLGLLMGGMIGPGRRNGWGQKQGGGKYRAK